MGLVAGSAGNPSGFNEEPVSLQDRRLRSKAPSDLLSGPAAARPIALAQAYLAIGAAVIGITAILLPHPSYFNTTGLLCVQFFSILCGIILYKGAGKISYASLRSGPALATLNTTVAVYFSGDATSGFAMFYLWIGLYSFYFPSSKKQAAFYLLWAAANYGLVFAIVPIDPPGGGEAVGYSFFTIAAGTLFCAGTLLTYLRGRVERLINRLTDVARTDPLTGLLNRPGLNVSLTTELERARPAARPVSLLVIDVDHMKEVNRTVGMEGGDETLQKLGSMIERSGRLIDTVARLGGQEFAVLLPEMDHNEAFLVAERLVVEAREAFAPPAVALTISVGIASFPAHGDHPEELFESAADASRAAKLLGRDRTVVFSPEVTSTLTNAARQDSMERQASLASALSLADALDLRDPYTASHSQTVGELAKLTAREMGMPEEHVQRVRLAGLLHDIGKVGIPDSILRKPGPLDDDEWVQMKRHPELGARILSGKGLEDLRDWVLAHHERHDGSGYPKGLSGREIPVEACVLSVCDAYEAMTSDRIYRPGMSTQAACDELVVCAGTQFNEAAVEALLRVVSRAQTSAEFRG